MIISSIDIQGGKIVQLRQGTKLELICDYDPIEWAKYLNRFGEVAVVDLDAAMGVGSNHELIKSICAVADLRVGGGIRSEQIARDYLRAGAKKLIVGTMATHDFLSLFPKEKIIVALDHYKGEVVDNGWIRRTGESVEERMIRLAPFCSEFLITFTSIEGTMSGMDLEEIKQLRDFSPLPITVAGGIANTSEAIAIAKCDVNFQMGMALYTHNLDLVETMLGLLDFAKEALIPTIVINEYNQILMLAYSSQDSLKLALSKGRGIYYSRSRQEIWEKGLSSGHSQELLACRFDCDRDALIFQVHQDGPACHTGSLSCFGDGVMFNLEILQKRLGNRLTSEDSSSYTAKLISNHGLLGKKIAEEAVEFVRAFDAHDYAPSEQARREIIWEAADVIFHLLVALTAKEVSLDEVITELNARQKPGRK